MELFSSCIFQAGKSEITSNHDMQTMYDLGWYLVLRYEITLRMHNVSIMYFVDYIASSVSFYPHKDGNFLLNK